jgi:uncharacterized Zn finger protein (UPF0148 family)
MPVFKGTPDSLNSAAPYSSECCYACGTVERVDQVIPGRVYCANCYDDLRMQYESEDAEPEWDEEEA